RPEVTGEPPDIGAVWVSGDDIHLVLAGEEATDPPAPFEAGSRGTWVLPGDAELPEVSGVAPLPALVTLGSQPGQHLLVDLERIGMLTITGPPERTSDLLRYLVAELAHNPWSELVEVTVAGFDDEQSRRLVALNPDRVTAASSLAEAVAALRQRVEHTTDALAAHGLADSLQGRVRDTATDTWAPQLLLIDQPPPEQEDLLLDLADAVGRANRRCAVAVVASTRPSVGSGRRTVTITDDGMLSAAFLDDSHPLPAVGLPAELLQPFADLVGDAASPADQPIPPAPEPWAAGTDLTGNPTGDQRDDLTGDSGAAAAPAVPAPRAAEPAAPALDADTPVQPLPVITTPAGPPDDPGLDEAVAAWWAGAIQPPRIALLGPVEVTASGQYPSHRARVCQELVVFLAARGADGAEGTEVTRAPWAQPGAPPTLRTAVIMSVRRWLGNAPDGEQWLSEAVPDGRYRLREGLLVDWHLFRRLRARGERRGAPGAADLRAALRLVRGAPLPEAGRPAG